MKITVEVFPLNFDRMIPVGIPTVILRQAPCLRKPELISNVDRPLDGTRYIRFM